MFGQNNHKQSDDNQIPDHSIDGAMHDDQNKQESQAFGHPGVPLDDNQQPQDNNPPAQVVTPGQTPSSPNPAADHHEADAESSSTANTSAQQGGTDTPHELIDIKQKALSQLSPLVGHLEQSPEEKFRTTMMMIQASDDQSLIQVAYDTAEQIQDEKIRAQALLDVVNEINYFTQQHHQ